MKVVGKYSTGVISKIKTAFGGKLSQYIFKRYPDIFSEILRTMKNETREICKNCMFPNISSLFEELPLALICPKNVNLAFDILFVSDQEYEFSTTD